MVKTEIIIGSTLGGTAGALILGALFLSRMRENREKEIEKDKER